MKAVVSPRTLSQALVHVARAVSTRTTLPVLNNILLVAEDAHLRLVATNLEISISRIIDAEVKEAGSTTAPARLLTDFIGSLPDEDLHLALDTKTETLELRCSRFQTHMKCLPATDFPASQTPGADATSLKLPASAFLHAIDQASIAASSDEARPVLTGVALWAQKGQLGLVTTDGHRLAVRDLELGGKSPDVASLIVPVRSLEEAARAFKGEEGTVEMIVAKAGNQVWFRAGRAEVASRLIDGSFPDWKKVVPADHATEVTLDRAAFTQTVKALSIFARDTANVVRLRIDSGTITLSAATNEVGDSSASLDVATEGVDTKIAFNARYLLDGLAVIAGEKIRLLLNGPAAPALVREGSGESFTYVLMPVRVSD